MANSVIETAFPTSSLVPKAETGITNFLQKYPDFDGRDVIIAIFDSGVDPRAAGLQEVHDGSVKVIERFDCSGCGDVDCSKKVTENSDGTITGLSGRTLKISPEMKSRNVNGNEYHVGMKSWYDLYPSGVRDKVQAKYKTEKWDPIHKTAVANTLREIQNLETQNSDAQKFNDKLKKEDLDQSLECLNFYEKKVMEVRTTYDCVLYQTERGWEAVIDTTEEGELEKAIVIGEYSKTHELKNLNEYMSISINVHDEGNILEMVGLCTSHGTHVASIASGNHSNKELDGVAPNAKIVSLTIGDGRLGSMETGTGLVRAITKVMELCNSGVKIDVINMSYGEFSHWSNAGRIGELMAEVVNKYGVVWVASAGNHGPALCTIGTPPDLSQPLCVGVGAYVSPQMMEAEHAMREKLPANVYTWTSRDPCIDGGQGVTICAPGAAITSVPEFTMMKSQLMNGTSMAAPHVAGAIALLISGLKQKNIKYSSYSIKRSLSITATHLDHVDKFAQGNGLLNVEKAFEHLVQYKTESENMVRFQITNGASGKGILLRRGQLKKSVEYLMSIEPVFANDKETAAQDKISFNLRIAVIASEPWVKCAKFLDLCYSMRKFDVEIDPVNLLPGVHTAKIRGYDSNCIEKGALFEIPVTVIQPFTVDIEVSRCFNNPQYNGIKEFKPNTIQRDFILVPNRATWAVLRMCSVGNKEKQVDKFYVHTVQILSQRYVKHLETQKLLPVRNESETIHAFKVEENNILELCIAKYWSNYGETQLKYSLEFHGISIISPSANTMIAANGIHRIDTTGLTTEEISPNLQFKTATQILKPIETKISPLSQKRDVIPSGRQIYQNLLVYNLHVTKAQEIALHAPILSTVLYESEFESQFWMLFDSNKMMIANGDAYSNSTYHKLEKGDYTIRLQVRHEKKELLEKIQEINMLAIFKLSNAINMDFYDHYNQAVVYGKKASTSSPPLKADIVKTHYLAPLQTERLQKAGLPIPCSWLNGTLTFVKDEYGRKVDTQSFKYILPDGMPTAAKKSNGNSNSCSTNNTSTSNNNSNSNTSSNNNNANNLKSNNNTDKDNTACSTNTTSPNNNNGNNGNSNTSDGGNSDASQKKSKTKADEYKDNLRDFLCSQITKVDLEQAEEIYNEVLKNHPKYLPVHTVFMQSLEVATEYKSNLPMTFHKSMKNVSTDDGSSSDVKKLIEHCKKIIECANKVITETDTNALLIYYGMKTDMRPDAAKIKTNMDKQKTTLLDALVKKGVYTCKQMILEKTPSNLLDINSTINTIFTPEQLDSIDNIYMEISKFIDMNDSKVCNFTAWHGYINLRFGNMMKIIQKMYDDKLNREYLEELCSISESKKWNHIVDILKKTIISANPNGYRPF
ncbi:tripeptidyl-peptidase 2 [Condylostylus longicornis]|uniref:tripeptidyl-peptidase 2 n=1 Tax=Condylostylus longicornis TaxID=2530218 RepID=UPI00244DB7D0|nr:tripeptidyl-peptidase 2 [Condylostylus longicornis]